MQMKRLSELRSLKELPIPSYYQGQCKHCPLHTARRTAQQFEDAATVVLGIAECAYYTQGLSRGQQDASRHYSLVLNWQDITFGCAKKVEDALNELTAKHTAGIFLITSCVPEITGDDVDAVAEQVSLKTGVPIGVVHTEHFKTLQESTGTEQTLTACLSFMEPAVTDESINILGMNREQFDSSELAALFDEADLRIFLPDCSVAALKTAPKARLNLVTSSNALPLAKAMEHVFGIPYFYLEGHIYPERMLRTYQKLFEILGRPFPELLLTKLEHCKLVISRTGSQCRGISYIYEKSQFPSLECNAFLTGLGMQPLAIQCDHLFPKDDSDYSYILSNADPYALSPLGTPKAMIAALGAQKVIGGRSGRRGDKVVGFDGILTFLNTLIHGEHGTGQRQGYKQRRKHS